VIGHVVLGGKMLVEISSTLGFDCEGQFYSNSNIVFQPVVAYGFAVNICDKSET
jgi:hypothetical protein